MVSALTLFSKFKKGGLELNDEGFMLVDTLLGLLTFTLIVALLIPAMLSLKTLDYESERKLEFHRNLYVSLTNNAHILPDESFFLEGEVCHVTTETLCHKIRRSDVN